MRSVVRACRRMSLSANQNINCNHQYKFSHNFPPFDDLWIYNPFLTRYIFNHVPEIILTPCCCYRHHVADGESCGITTIIVINGAIIVVWIHCRIWTIVDCHGSCKFHVWHVLSKYGHIWTFVTWSIYQANNITSLCRSTIVRKFLYWHRMRWI
jgi:hypothetical protein